MAIENAEKQTRQDGIWLRLKNIEVILIDGLIIAGTLLLDRFSLWQYLDLPLKTAEDIERAGRSMPPFILLLAPATVIVMLYAMARKSKPGNPLLQVFYAIGIMGIMWTCGGITTLVFNSVIMFLPGLLIGFIVALKHEGGDSKLFAIVNRVYDHQSRIIVLPVIVYIYVSGMEYLMLTGVPTAYAIIIILMLYMPVRIMLMFKEPYRGYHFLSMTAAFIVFTYSTVALMAASPAEPVWQKIGGYLGDRVRVVEENGDRAVVYANVLHGSSYWGTSFFVVAKNLQGKWTIVEEMKPDKYLKRQ